MRNSAIIVLCCLGCSSAAAMPGGEPAAGLGDHCQEVEAPCIRQWTEMSASERAHLWPYLDEVSRAMHWRSMSTRERSDDGIMIEFIVGRRFRAFGGLFEACRKQLDGHAFIHSCS